MYILTENDFLDQEEWRVIKDYPQYEVSNLGRVRHNTNKGIRLLKPYDNSAGYLVVRLFNSQGWKYKMISRLVAEAFIENPETKPCVDHINRERYDNRSSNLRWVTYTENNQNCSRNYLHSFQKSVPIICVETGKKWSSITKTARDIGVSKGSIIEAIKSSNHTCHGMHFQRVECQPENEYIHF